MSLRSTVGQHLFSMTACQRALPTDCLTDGLLTLLYSGVVESNLLLSCASVKPRVSAHDNMPTSRISTNHLASATVTTVTDEVDLTVSLTVALTDDADSEQQRRQEEED